MAMLDVGIAVRATVPLLICLFCLGHSVASIHSTPHRPSDVLQAEKVIWMRARKLAIHWLDMGQTSTFTAMKKV